MTTPLLIRDCITDYLNSGMRKYEDIMLDKDELQTIANCLEELHNIREYVEPLRTFDTHNLYLEELKKIVN